MHVSQDRMVVIVGGESHSCNECLDLTQTMQVVVNHSVNTWHVSAIQKGAYMTRCRFAGCQHRRSDDRNNNEGDELNFT